jgi:hypothetical protein
MTFQEIRIIATCPCITNQLRDANTISRRSYIDDVLSINNSRFAEFLPLIYPPELEVKETTDTASCALFLDVSLTFDDSGQLSTNIVYHLVCWDGIYFDKILVSEYKLFKRSNKANLCIALVQQPVSQMKTTVVNSVLTFMINGTTSILRS